VFREINAGVVDQRINRFEFVLRNFGDASVEQRKFV
jgi:hypothetical protein